MSWPFVDQTSTTADAGAIKAGTLVGAQAE